MFLQLLKRKTVITGHYGSGKTEFTISLAMYLKENVYKDNHGDALAVVDLDVVNPYFRSRERRKELSDAGIKIYGSVYETDVTAEIPELGATVRTPLENEGTRVIADLGGNDSGALILNQFKKYFTDDETLVLTVVNANRPETGSPEGVISHITAIETATGLKVTYIVNNTHLIRETKISDIAKGNELCRQVCKQTGKKLLCDCYPAGIIDSESLAGISENPFPMGMYMRPAWLDK